MKPIQHDDIYDDHNQPKRKWKWIHTSTRFVVEGENKKDAITLFKSKHSINVTRKQIERI